MLDDEIASSGLEEPSMKSITLDLSDKCSAKCDHCCLECGPQNLNQLAEEKIESILMEIERYSWIEVVNITGGEPFLNRSLLYKIFSKIMKMNKQATCVTNGFWAVTEEDTYREIQKICSLGVTSLSISISDFHQKYVPIENIKNILNAALQLPIRISLKIAVTETYNALDLIKNLGKSICDVSIMFFPVCQVGRAVNIQTDDIIKRYHGDMWMPCIDNNLLINSDGKCYPCCSPCIFETKLCVGNIYEEDLGDIIERTRKNLLIYYLHKNGVNWIKELIERNFGYHYPEYYVSPCELCLQIFRDNDIIGKLVPVLKEYYEKDKVSEI